MLYTSKHYFDLNGKHVDSITTGTIPVYDNDNYIFVENNTPLYENKIVYKEGSIVEMPLSVSMAQARIALIDVGLIDKVQGTLNAIPDEKERAKALAWWEYAQTVDRSSAIVQQLISALGLSADQVDELFLAAGNLK